MVFFHTIYTLSSDGKDRINGIDNIPSKDQQQQSEKKVGGKTIIDYYRALQKTDGKYADWLQKLACMVVREMIPHDWEVISANPQVSYILYDFPAGFSLWEHVKRTNDADGKLAKTKSHAAGGHDRMDAYLYGHPSKKRYRSPAEFFPHLLWLMTDESKNRDNCRCVCCCPDALQSLTCIVKSEVSAKNKLQAASVGQKKANSHGMSSEKTSKSVTVIPPVLSPSESRQFISVDPGTGVKTIAGLEPPQAKQALQQAPIAMPVPPTSKAPAIPSQANAEVVSSAAPLNTRPAPVQTSTSTTQQQHPNQILSLGTAQHEIQQHSFQAGFVNNNGHDHNQQFQPSSRAIQPHHDADFSYSTSQPFQQFVNNGSIAYEREVQHNNFPMLGNEQSFDNYGLDFNTSDFSAQPGDTSGLMDDINQYINMSDGDYQDYSR